MVNLFIGLILLILGIVGLTFFALSVRSQDLKTIGGRIERSMKHALDDIFLFIPIQKLLVLWMSAIVLICAMALLVSSTNIFIFGLFISVTAPLLIFRWKRQRHRSRIELALPDLLNNLAASLLAGYGFQVALREAQSQSPQSLAYEMNLVIHQIDCGESVKQALNDFADRVQLEVVGYAVQVMIIGYQQGGQQASGLQNVARTVSEQLRHRQKLAALTAQAKMQAGVMAALPVVLFLALQVVHPQSTELLLHDPLGQILLGLSALLLILGYLFSKHILNAASS